MELELRQEQQLSMRQLHSLRLLQMGRLEIREYLETVAQENPTVELELPPRGGAPDPAGRALAGPLALAGGKRPPEQLL